MGDGPHVLLWNKTKKPLAIALRGGENGSDLSNVKYKLNQNCHYESPLCNEYILIKNSQNERTICGKL
jgi:hypothetical protein